MYIHKKLKIRVLRVFDNKQVLQFLNNVGQRGTKNALFQLEIKFHFLNKSPMGHITRAKISMMKSA